MAEEQLEILTSALRPSQVAASVSMLVLRLQMRLRPAGSNKTLSENGPFSRHRPLGLKTETPSVLSDRARGSVTVLVTGQDVEVAQGRGVVCRSTLQNHHPAGDTQTRRQTHIYTSKYSIS